MQATSGHGICSATSAKSSPQLHDTFSLVLMVNHACNLRCTYCYTGAKFNRRMSREIAEAALTRAVASVKPGGTLEIGFFGGEPLIEAEFILDCASFIRHLAQANELRLQFSLTTNGTQTHPAAWQVMLLPDFELAVSCDGAPQTHDTHRRLANGHGSSAQVMNTIRDLVRAGKEFHIVTVVRPDNLPHVRDGMEFLYANGVRQFDLSLDLWTQWNRAAVAQLDHTVGELADWWAAHLPHASVNWFDEKAALLARIPFSHTTARCGFGAGEIAVAPSGNLYPCERLIGDDRGENPMRLPGHALDGADFLDVTKSGDRSHDACDRCALQASCSTSCRCSNYVRTGDVTKPDGLLCLWEKALLRETARVLRQFQQPQTTEQYESRCSG